MGCCGQIAHPGIPVHPGAAVLLPLCFPQPIGTVQGLPFSVPSLPGLTRHL